MNNLNDKPEDQLEYSNEWETLMSDDTFYVSEDFLKKIQEIAKIKKLDWAIPSITKGALTFRQMKPPIVVSKKFINKCIEKGYKKIEEIQKIAEYLAGGAKLENFEHFNGLIIQMNDKETKQMLIENFRKNYSFPYFIYFSSTNMCNLDCNMCSYHSPNVKHKSSYYGGKPKHLEVKIFDKITNEMRGKRSVIGFGGTGEPLLNPNFTKFLRIAADKKIQSFFFNTNGHLLDKKVREAVFETSKKISVLVSVSLDATTPETYQKIRNNPNFNKVIENLEALIEGREKNKLSNLKIFVAFVNQPTNNTELKDFIKKWKNKVDQIGVLGLLSENSIYKDHLFEINKNKPCEYLWDEVDILPTGDVIPCCKMVGELDKIEPKDMSFGSVYELTMDEIWNGKKFKSYREKMIEKDISKLQFCNECEMWQRNFFRYKTNEDGLWKYSVTDQTLINDPVLVKNIKWR